MMTGLPTYSLMVGDWVYFGKKAGSRLCEEDCLDLHKIDGKAPTIVEYKNVPCRIVAMSEHGIELMVKDTRIMAMYDMVELIPIDECVLASSGWVKKDGTTLWMPQDSDRVYVDLKCPYNCIVHIDTRFTYTITKVDYLNELQDILRSCRMTSIADNIRF